MLRCATVLLACLALLALCASANAGRVGGPGRIQTKALARATDTYEVKFRGDQVARIQLQGDGDTDLDLYVYDEKGQLIAKDEDDTDYCIVTWTPAATQAYTIKVINRGNVWNAYTMTTN